MQRAIVPGLAILTLLIAGCVQTGVPDELPPLDQPQEKPGDAASPSGTATNPEGGENASADKEPHPPPDPTDAGPEPSAPSEPVELSRTLQGRILWRLGSDGEPFWAYEGDSPCAHFLVPEDTSILHVHVEWNSNQHFGLEINSPVGDKYQTYPPAFTPADQPTSPAEIAIEDPPSGAWDYWVGPLVADANVEWNLTFTWTVDRADATVEETNYTGTDTSPCYD